MSRSARRRRNRDAAVRVPVVMVGDGIVATELGHQFEARAHADLPPKRPGEHRWIATAAYVLNGEQLAGLYDADQRKILDHENLMYFGVGCWDCERPLGVIEVGSHCPAEGAP